MITGNAPQFESLEGTVYRLGGNLLYDLFSGKAHLVLKAPPIHRGVFFRVLHSNEETKASTRVMTMRKLEA
jgi:hypothetical protein